MPKIKSPSEYIQCTDIASCFQAIYNFFFALLIALAFLYFLWGAIQYLISGANIYPKEEGKKKMKDSIIAVIIALSVPIILNMINPDIFRAELSIPIVEARLPGYISAPETPPADILPSGQKVVDAQPNSNLMNKLRDINYIKYLIIDCDALRMTIVGVNNEGQEIQVANDIPINTGKRINGKNCNEKNVPNSHTTPKGSFKISGKRYNPNGLVSLESGASLGTRALVYHQQRGLLIHGSATEEKNRSFPETWGCIRMKNEDLAAIFDKVRVGTTILKIK
ncbi:MAG: hypothetical protein KatS3mg096_066 [Candidatus Parcubacteria bacterium]|nr:MAG: hypothetical protein KatS3mg096_066 [Candidatus Parcubacteria bacterium]